LGGRADSTDSQSALSSIETTGSVGCRRGGEDDRLDFVTRGAGDEGIDFGLRTAGRRDGPASLLDGSWQSASVPLRTQEEHGWFEHRNFLQRPRQSSPFQHYNEICEIGCFISVYFFCPAKHPPWNTTFPNSRRCHVQAVWPNAEVENTVELF